MLHQMIICVIVFSVYMLIGSVVIYLIFRKEGFSNCLELMFAILAWPLEAIRYLLKKGFGWRV